MDCDHLTYNIKQYCNITSWLSEMRLKGEMLREFTYLLCRIWLLGQILTPLHRPHCIQREGVMQQNFQLAEMIDRFVYERIFAV